MDSSHFKWPSKEKHFYFSKYLFPARLAISIKSLLVMKLCSISTIRKPNSSCYSFVNYSNSKSSLQGLLKCRCRQKQRFLDTYIDYSIFCSFMKLEESDDQSYWEPWFVGIYFLDSVASCFKSRATLPRFLTVREQADINCIVKVSEERVTYFIETLNALQSVWNMKDGTENENKNKSWRTPIWTSNLFKGFTSIQHVTICVVICHPDSRRRSNMTIIQVKRESKVRALLHNDLKRANMIGTRNQPTLWGLGLFKLLSSGQQKARTLSCRTRKDLISE